MRKLFVKVNQREDEVVVMKNKEYNRNRVTRNLTLSDCILLPVSVINLLCDVVVLIS